MDVARLLHEHSKLRSLSAALVEVVSTTQACDFDELARRRWDLARMVHMHLAYEERQLFAPLAADLRPEVRAAAMKAKRGVEQLHGLYKEHVERWDADEIQKRWPEFQVAVRRMVGRMLMKIEHEEADLFPLVAKDVDVDRCWRPGMRNWAGDGVALQPLLTGGTLRVDDASAHAIARYPAASRP
ncbi:hemerythrin domain-containing protein [Sphingomonas sp. RB3P16]|uniref:hemerythrin domain-containing protein n=1 Tax=Parasphingomonas frigoris TaxID=3096163 RepID=UPI002FC6458D